MSCCNFSGVDNRNYNLDPETERITEAIYSDWTEAAGGPTRLLPPLMDRSADTDPTDDIGVGRMVAGADGCQGGDCPPGQTCVNGRCEITTRVGGPYDDRPAPFDDRRVGGPWDRDRSWPFDGGAVKQNWVPLVVLGLSLVVGIAISEWASKKYIK